MIRQIYYRGSLDFCNFSCSYCPFSKKKESKQVLQRDRKELFRFVHEIIRTGFNGAIQIVPYGEAMLHEYYWEAMAELSRHEKIQAVGAQSNFSFPVERMLRVFVDAGGRREKLRLWGTFHPEMIGLDDFLAQCRILQEAGILFCVGSVGVPGNIRILQKLRERLEDEIYMWINKMDGLGRRYTKEEIRLFAEIDPCFELELRRFQPHHTGSYADPSKGLPCRDSLLIEGGGRIRPCVLCRQSMGDLYKDGWMNLPEKSCSRKVCDCYLSYGSRSDIPELSVFCPYPAFRIPGKEKEIPEKWDEKQV